ncbi:MAG: ABC transporter ATP-binding protein [Candidatus Binatia bacterium]
MSFLRIQDLTKRFGEVVAVNRLNIEIRDGEFFTLLGSSGCGKTTTLRMVGGLEKPDGGAIHLGERCLVSHAEGFFIKPERRDMGMVFQSYALWPHMTVFENVSYPLKLRRMKGPVIREKTRAALELVGLAGLEERTAPALSGGQQQRVALARALVFSPRVLLLDEPLSNLDARLREEMRRELKSLQRRVGVTVVFVTHDQMEALSLSDRIAIMNYGRLEQVGTPEEVYYRPATPFARDFLGKVFALTGKIVEANADGCKVELRDLAAPPVRVRACPPPAGGAWTAGMEVMVAIRPEQIALSSSTTDGKRNVLPVTLQASQFLGDRYEYTVGVGSESRVLTTPASNPLKPGQQIYLELDPEAITLWPTRAA